MRPILIILSFALSINTFGQLPINRLINESLFLSSDSMFYYSRGINCSSSIVTKGRWSVTGDKLTLSCFDSIDCVPNVKVTELSTRKDDAFITISYDFSSALYNLGHRDSSFSSYIYCDDEEYNKNGYGDFLNRKVTYFPVGRCRKIFFSFEYPFNKYNGHTISGEYDVLIKTDYPPSMLFRGINFYSFGTSVYTIKADGLYFTNGELAYDFNK